jgi:hypothetical protein
MRETQGKAILLKDYAPPAFLIARIALDVDIRSDDIESSEQGFLNAVRRVAEDAGVQCQA